MTIETQKVTNFKRAEDARDDGAQANATGATPATLGRPTNLTTKLTATFDFTHAHYVYYVYYAYAYRIVYSKHTTPYATT